VSERTEGMGRSENMLVRGVLASKEDLEMFKAAQYANKFR